MMQPLERIRAATKGMLPDTMGVRFIEAAPERLLAEIDVTGALCTVPGIMHGGAIMAFADTLGGVATSLNLPPGAGTTTIESKTNFFAPGRTGETGRGDVPRLGRGRAGRRGERSAAGSRAQGRRERRDAGGPAVSVSPRG